LAATPSSSRGQSPDRASRAPLSIPRISCPQRERREQQQREHREPAEHLRAHALQLLCVGFEARRDAERERERAAVVVAPGDAAIAQRDPLAAGQLDPGGAPLTRRERRAEVDRHAET